MDIFTRDLELHPLDQLIDDRLENRYAIRSVALPTKRLPLLPLPRGFDITDVSPFPSVAEFALESAKDPQIPLLHLNRDPHGVFSKGSKVYVPATLRSRILFVFHHSHVGAHVGVNSLVRRVQQRFYWPYLQADAQHFVDRCLVCRRRRRPGKAVLAGNLLSRDVLSLIAIDLVGPIDHQQRSYRLLTIICHASKYATIVCMPDKCQGIDIWSALVTHWFSIWSFPSALLSDNGLSFCNKLLDVRCREFGIFHERSTRYYPQGNGVVESFHQYVKKAISSTTGTHPDLSLQEAIDFVLIAYRSTPHSSSGDTPFRLLTGLDFVLPNLQAWTEETFSSRSMAERLILVLHLRHAALQVSLSQVLKRQSNPEEQAPIAVGDLVIGQLSEGDSRQLRKFFDPLKLAPLWSEPLRVTRVSNNGLTLQAQSVWHDGLKRQFNRNQLQLLPRDCDAALLPLVLADIQKDRIIHRAAPAGELPCASDTATKVPTQMVSLDYSALTDLTTAPDRPAPPAEDLGSAGLPPIANPRVLAPYEAARELLLTPRVSGTESGRKRPRVEIGFVLVRRTEGTPKRGEVEL